MDKKNFPTLHSRCNYLTMLGSTLIHVNKHVPIARSLLKVALNIDLRLAKIIEMPAKFENILNTHSFSG